MIKQESVRPIGAEVQSARSFSASAINRLARWFGRHWLLLLNLAWGLFVAVPWLAPLLMEAGW
ncbi:MAG: hypothetical protein ACRDHL_10605, partial [Candidatus Promineifilaceae bacterium]